MTRAARPGKTEFDVAALSDYVAQVRRSMRGARDPAATRDDEPVTAESVRWRRVVALHLHDRLPRGRYADAAASGLQDTEPRAGQLALHARVAQTQPDAWAHPSLAQLWFRWADYIVPRADLALFTLGTMPSDPRHAAAVEALADIVLAAVAEVGGDSSAVAARLDGLPLRSASVTGRVLIRWDARTVEVLPNERPSGEIDAARIGLARRFLHFYGPASAASLAKFSGMARADSEAVFEQLAPELSAVALDGRRRWLLTSDIDSLLAAAPAEGVRLLPPGDPLLYMRDTEGEPPPPIPVDPGRKVTQRLVNSLKGRLLIDGEVAGAWGRTRGDVTVDGWRDLGRRREDVEVEAAAVVAAVGYPLRLRWLDRPV